MNGYFDLAEAILKKCLEVYDIGMIVDIETMIQEKIADDHRAQCIACQSKYSFLPRTIKDLSNEIYFEDDLEEQYNKLVSSGMFFVLFPTLTGEWILDKEYFNKIYNKGTK